MKLLLAFPQDRDWSFLIDYFRTQEITAEPYGSITQLAEAHGVLVFSPVRCRDYTLNPVNVWRTYLQKNKQYRKVALLPAGVQLNEHPAYLDLLGPPVDFSAYLQERPLTADHWASAFDNGHTDSRLLLLRFFEGHDQDSILPPLAKVNRKLKLLDRILRAGASYEEARNSLYSEEDPAFLQRSWQELLARWQAFGDNLCSLPFTRGLAILGKSIEALSQFFAAECRDEAMYRDLPVLPQFEKLYKTLADIRKYADA